MYMILRRSSGATAVRDTAPATPPEMKSRERSSLREESDVSAARKCVMLEEEVGAGAAGVGATGAGAGAGFIGGGRRKSDRG